MRRITTLICSLFFALMLYGQTEVTLGVSQLPEYGYTVGTKEASIEKGAEAALGADLEVFGGAGSYTYSWEPSAEMSNPWGASTSVKPDETQSYQQTVTDANGCKLLISYTVTVTATATNLMTFSVSGQGLSAEVYPNPAESEVQLQLSGQSGETVLLSIIDKQGRVVQVQTLSSLDGERTEQVDLQVATGTYTMLIETGSQKVTRELIVK